MPTPDHIAVPVQPGLARRGHSRTRSVGGAPRICGGVIRAAIAKNRSGVPGEPFAPPQMNHFPIPVPRRMVPACAIPLASLIGRQLVGDRVETGPPPAVGGRIFRCPPPNQELLSQHHRAECPPSTEVRPRKEWPSSDRQRIIADSRRWKTHSRPSFGARSKPPSCPKMGARPGRAEDVHPPISAGRTCSHVFGLGTSFAGSLPQTSISPAIRLNRGSTASGNSRPAGGARNQGAAGARPRFAYGSRPA